MSYRLATFVAAAACLVGLACVSSFAAMQRFAEQVPLNAIESKSLGFRADLAELGRERTAYFARQRLLEDRPGGLITVFDLESERVVRTFETPFDVEVLEYQPQTDKLYAAGNSDGTFYVLRVDAGSQQLDAALLTGPIKGATLAVARNGQVFVGSRESKDIYFFEPRSFMPLPDAREAFAEGRRVKMANLYYVGQYGVSGLAISADGKTLFISDSGSPRVAAFNLVGKQAIVDQISLDSAGVKDMTPLVMKAQAIDPESGPANSTSSLVLMDIQRARIVIADFNPSFHTLDLIADVSFPADSLGHRLSVGRRGVVESGALLDTNAGLSTILIGSKARERLLLFGRNDRSLELVREFSLPAAPIALDVSEDGQLALVLHLDGASVSILTGAPSPPPPGDKGAVTDLTGSEDIRSIQRKLTDLGHSVGVVDGVYGLRTSRALAKALEERNFDPAAFKLDAMTSEDLKRALKTLETLK